MEDPYQLFKSVRIAARVLKSKFADSDNLTFGVSFDNIGQLPFFLQKFFGEISVTISVYPVVAVYDVESL